MLLLNPFHTANVYLLSIVIFGTPDLSVRRFLILYINPLIFCASEEPCLYLAG